MRGVIDPQLRSGWNPPAIAQIKSLSTPRHLALLNELVSAAAMPRVTELGNQRARTYLQSWLTAHSAARRVASNSWNSKVLPRCGTRRVSPPRRARYSAEAVSGVFNGPAKRLADALSEVTEILGDHQDACIAQDVPREMAATDGIDGRTGFALGLLHEHEFETELHNRLEFKRIWPRVRRVHKSTKLA